MDSSNGISRRAGNAWLPAGLAALLWSLEKADPISPHWKSLNITQAVKSLLQTGSSQSERCSQRRRISSVGLFLDSMRDFHSKISACSNFGIGVSFHAPGSCPKFYCCEDDCDSTCCRCSSRGFGGCNDPSCDSCDICDLGYLSGCDWSEVFALEPPHPLASSGGFLQIRSQSTDSRQQSFEQDDRQLYLTVSRPNQVYSTTRISEGIRKGLYKTKDTTGRIIGNFGRMLTRRSAEGVAHRVVIGKVDSEFASEDTTTEQRRSSTISLNHSETENAAGQVTRKERETRAAEETELERPTVYATENAMWISAKVSKNALQDSVKSSATSPAFGLQRVLALPLRTCSGFRSLGNRGQVLATVAEWQARSSSQEDSSSLLDRKETGSWNFRMGQNAIAGALAGAFVSLCLHPIDTIKTVIQAQTGQHHNLFPVLSSIISQRGLRGLYRGLGSNLASSAPTSAIYTFTYEAVKLGLLPFIPQGMSALAHCTAGGCASLATSIVYTPSECVKQQMQLGTLYRNSWLAFVGLLKNGGLPLLYSGWGAVLCRNVPQSVIKFYTYEGLKLWALSWQEGSASLSTKQTLAIGGIAGSTAAFFTTPFDVIKTRLQTQAELQSDLWVETPASLQQYKGVFHALQCIAMTEGVNGLYRGLVPRLVIYVSQGALFFTSYECIKHVLAVEIPCLCTKNSHTGCQNHGQVPIAA